MIVLKYGQHEYLKVWHKVMGKMTIIDHPSSIAEAHERLRVVEASMVGASGSSFCEFLCQKEAKSKRPRG